MPEVRLAADALLVLIHYQNQRYAALSSRDRTTEASRHCWKFRNLILETDCAGYPRGFHGFRRRAGVPTAVSLHFAPGTPRLRKRRDAKPIHSQEDQHGDAE
jgi:hypothetical protein